MKKTISVAVGRRNFILDEDAYNALGAYLDSFRASLDPISSAEVMEELEMRIADLFKENLKGREVVDMEIVERIIRQLGLPNSESDRKTGSCNTMETYENIPATKRFYRNPDGKMIGGVCSGLSVYLNVDVILIRIMFVVAFILGLSGFWIYVIFCIVVPSAGTAAEKCELRGIPTTAENIRRFSGTNI
ncbi:MAG: PspC domain-containing protein [Bacteroidales bacterium]|nr:PspC domain-containing protein [Bacteroidales bacterium]